MGKKYGIIIFILILLVAGTGISVLIYFYPFDIINHFLFRQNFSLDPDIELDPEKKYNITLWYPPIYRTVPPSEEKEDIMGIIKEEVEKVYPNIDLQPEKVDFLNYSDKMNKAIEAGKPPDIYFNINDDACLSKAYQVPVERYLSDEELAGFYTVDWEEIIRKNQHLWGWPVLVHDQGWLGNFNFEIKNGISNQYQVNNISQNYKSGVILNYYDETLLRQLLSMKGIEYLPMGRTGLTDTFYKAFKEILFWADTIRGKYHINNRKTEEMIREFMSDEKKVIIGPANIWLEYFLTNKRKTYTDLVFKGQIKNYWLSVFFQKGKKSSEQVKAAMEVGKYISKNFSQEMAAKLNVKPGYQLESDNRNDMICSNQIMQVPVEYRKIWEEKIWQAWLDFWEEGLNPEEIITRIKNN